MSSLPWFVSKPDPMIYHTGVPLFVDFETTIHGNGLAIYKENRIVLACWQLGWNGPMRRKWGGEFEMQDLLADIAKADFIVAFNAKFELQWLARCGLKLEEVLVYDVQLAEYVIGGNRWQTGRLSLEQTAVRYGLEGKVSLVSKMIKAGVSCEDIPRDWLLKYCRQDVRLLPIIMMRQLAVMEGTRLLPVVYSRCLLTPVLADMETEGLKLDHDLIRIRIDEKEKEFKELTIKLNGVTGGINLASPLQVAKFLYDDLKFEEHKEFKDGKWQPRRTETKRRLTGGDDVAALKAKTAEQRAFIDLYVAHRELHSELSKYLRKFLACCEENEGVLYAKFNQTQTQTHRLSSTGLDYSTQLQNLPRSYKPLFMAKRSGWLMGEADGAQLEFRIAAHMGRDAQALADIVAKVDVHTFTSETLTSAGQPTNRQDAKSHTFKPLYGGSSGTPAEQTYYKAFKAKYTGVAKMQADWINTVLMEKKLETEWGLVFYWPDTKLTRSGYVTNTPSICNYPVQSLATAEVIPLALVCMWHRLKRTTDRIVLVNTVHDSIVAEVHPDAVDEFHLVSKQALIVDARQMMVALYGIEMVAPLGCGIKVAAHWADTKDETKYEEGE